MLEVPVLVKDEQTQVSKIEKYTVWIFEDRWFLFFWANQESNQVCCFYLSEKITTYAKTSVTKGKVSRDERFRDFEKCRRGEA